VNWDSRVWAVPAERTKQGRVHEVPLSDRAVALLERQKERANGSPFVFTGYGREGLGERAMAWLLRDMGEEATVHGMRSSFRDYCGNETDFKREHVEEALGHVVGSAVERAYRRKPGLEKRRAILAHWAEYCG
jgi:integrase